MICLLKSLGCPGFMLQEAFVSLMNFRDGQEVQVARLMIRPVKIAEQVLLQFAFLFSDGLLGKETDFFLHCLCEFLCVKWE